MITYYFPPVVYGSSLRVLNFAKHLINYNWNPSVLTLNHVTFSSLKDFTLLGEVKQNNIKVYAVNLLNLFSKIASANFPGVKKELLPIVLSSISKIFGLREPEDLWTFKAIKFGERILKQNKYNVIIAFVPPLSALYVGAYLSKKFKIPLVIDYSAIPYWKKALVKREKKLLKFGSALIVDNRKIKDHLLLNHPFLDYNFVRIIPTGIDPNHFKNETLLPINDDRFTLTFSSGKIGGKKIKLILSAISHLVKKNKNFKNSLLLNLLGIPSNEILNLVSKLQLKENVNIYLNIQRENYIKILSSSDYLIYTEEIDIANIPYDYIAVGKPYIAIINGQNNYRYIIGDYKNSIIADANEPESIVNAIEKAFENFTNNKAITPKINPENYDINKIIINLVRELENLIFD